MWRRSKNTKDTKDNNSIKDKIIDKVKDEIASKIVEKGKETIHKTIQVSQLTELSKENTINDKPLVNAINDKPLVNAINDKPLVNAINDKPLVNAINDKPLANAMNDKPLANAMNEIKVKVENFINIKEEIKENLKISIIFTNILFFLGLLINVTKSANIINSYDYYNFLISLIGCVFTCGLSYYLTFYVAKNVKQRLDMVSYSALFLGFFVRYSLNTCNLLTLEILYQPLLLFFTLFGIVSSITIYSKFVVK